MALRYQIGKKIAWLLFKTGKVNRCIKELEEGKHILSLCFHAPDLQLFDTCVAWLAGKGFRFISVAELESVIDGKQPFPKKAVVITLDDGWRTNLAHVAPVALKYKAPVEIFVSTQMVEDGSAYWWSYINKARHSGLVKENTEYFKTIDNDERLKRVALVKEKIQLPREALTPDELKEICANPYVHIGSHTVTHPILPCCRNEMSKEEITRSKETLENWTGKEIRYFAYPNGDYGNREISFLKKAGYTIAFTTEQCYLTEAHLKKRYQLPRFMMVEGTSAEENICRMIGAWPLKKKKRRVIFP